MTDEEKNIILCYAENDMNVSKAAEKMHYHRNTILYRFTKIHRKTGLNPQRFYDLCRLVEMIGK